MSEKDQEKSPDMVTDAEKDLAIAALADFKKKNYTGCLQYISKLESTRPGDFKIVHNKAVVEFFKSDLKKTEQFQKNLTSICSQFKIKVDKLEEIDYCIAQFNQAIILFHQKQYTASQRIMDRVYKFIEPMEESLAKQVSLLSIELQLCLRRPDKALTLITYLENNLMYGGSIPLNKIGKDKKLPLPAPKPISEEFQKKLSKYKLRCYLMNHSLTLAAKELGPMLKNKNKTDVTFMAANLEYLKGNFSEAMKSLSGVGEGDLVYSETGESSKIMYNNNMGIIHHALGKPNLACHYFQTALKEEISISQNLQKKDNNDKPLYTMGGSKYHELMYNLGISHLYAGRPTQAFDCLIICVRRYHRNSRLWLRIAECCITVHKESNEPDFDMSKKQKEMIVDVVGTREKQKVILTTSLSKDKKYNVESQSFAIPVPTLEFAFLCLSNAKLLIPSASADVSPEPLFLVPGVTPPAPPPSPSLSPSSPSSANEIQALRNTILAATTYVCICLGDHMSALRHGKELLAQDKLSGIHKLLGHLYVAECLVVLDQIQEAIEVLHPHHVSDISFTFLCDYVGDEAMVKTNPAPKWFPNHLTSAHAVMHYNMAVAKTIRGQLDQANTILKQIWQQRTPQSPVPAHMFMLVIYIELQLGQADVARNLIRQYVMPPPSTNKNSVSVSLK